MAFATIMPQSTVTAAFAEHGYDLITDPTLADALVAGTDEALGSFNLDPASPDSYVSLNGAPEGFDLPPADLPVETFLSWHTQEQLSYIYKNLTDQNAVLRIGNDVPGGGSLDVMLTPAGVDVSNPGNAASFINITALDAAAVGMLSVEDQNRLLDDDLYPNGFNTFTESVVPALGFETDIAAVLTDPESPLAQLNVLLVDLLSDSTSSDLSGALQQLSEAGLTGVSENAEAVIEDLTKQIEAFFEQAEANVVFDPAELNSAAKELLDRVAALNNFAISIDGLVDAQSVVDIDADGLLILGSVSAQEDTAQLTTLATSFGNLVRAEAAVASAFDANQAIVDGIGTDDLGRPLDGPALMGLFIFNLSLKLQSINQADTEAFNQLNELVKSYGVMQDLINGLLSQFDASDTDQKLALNLDDMTTEQRAAVTMFLGDFSGDIQSRVTVELPFGEFFVDADTPASVIDAVGSAVNQHPAELQENVTRPTLDILEEVSVNLDFDPPRITGVEFKALDRQAWTNILQQLNDAVTQLNQNSQLAFNEITSRSQQQTTFFEGASDALAKLQDTVKAMTSNIA